MESDSDSYPFNLDQVVWARVEGHPWWPAVVVGINEYSDSENPGDPFIKYEVNFIGETSQQVLSSAELDDDEMEDFLASYEKRKNTKKPLLRRSMLFAKNAAKDKNFRAKTLDILNAKIQNRKIPTPLSSTEGPRPEKAPKQRIKKSEAEIPIGNIIPKRKKKLSEDAPKVQMQRKERKDKKKKVSAPAPITEPQAPDLRIKFQELAANFRTKVLNLPTPSGFKERNVDPKMKVKFIQSKIHQALTALQQIDPSVPNLNSIHKHMQSILQIEVNSEITNDKKILVGLRDITEIMQRSNDQILKDLSTIVQSYADYLKFLQIAQKLQLFLQTGQRLFPSLAKPEEAVKRPRAPTPAQATEAPKPKAKDFIYINDENIPDSALRKRMVKKVFNILSKQGLIDDLGKQTALVLEKLVRERYPEMNTEYADKLKYISRRASRLSRPDALQVFELALKSLQQLLIFK